MRIKNHFHIYGFAITLALKQRLGTTRKGSTDALFGAHSIPVINPLCSFFQTKERSLPLPDGVLKAVRSRSCDAVDVVAQMQESVENLQLKSAALVDPAPETKQWIRCLAISAKNENRMDIVTYLRSIAPAGTTGELAVKIKVHHFHIAYYTPRLPPTIICLVLFFLLLPGQC